MTSNVGGALKNVSRTIGFVTGFMIVLIGATSMTQDVLIATVQETQLNAQMENVFRNTFCATKKMTVGTAPTR